jgi:nucleotide-binding universal stress UspA family protein
MVGRCVNPTCNTEIKSLKTGDLYALKGRSESAHFSWLCSVCLPLVDLFLDLTGSVTVGPKLLSVFGRHPNPIRRLPLPHSASEHSPRIRTGLYRQLHDHNRNQSGLVLHRSEELGQSPAVSPKITFKKVLLATDLSNGAQLSFRRALGLCASLGATLSILHVFEYTPIPPETRGESLEQDQFYETAQTSLDELEQVARRAGVICATSIGSGTPSSTILETIDSTEADLVVLGTRGLHGFERLVFGSTAEAVLRKAACPVLTVGPHVLDQAVDSQPEGPIVFVTDFHRTTTCAIRYATFFCKVMGAPLHCLDVHPQPLDGGCQNTNIPQSMIDALQRIAAEYGTSIDPPICAIAHGNEITNTVIEYARQKNAKLIVLGVSQAPTIASQFPAHIAYCIIAEAPCPVLTMAFGSDLIRRLDPRTACPPADRETISEAHQQ